MNPGINTYKLNSSGEERMIENGPSHVEAKLGPLPGIVFTNTRSPGSYKDFLFSFVVRSHLLGIATVFEKKLS